MTYNPYFWPEFVNNIHLPEDVKLGESHLVPFPYQLGKYGLQELRRVDPDARLIEVYELPHFKNAPTINTLQERYDEIYASTPCYLLGDSYVLTRIDPNAVRKWAIENHIVAMAMSPGDFFFPEDLQDYTIEKSNDFREWLVSGYCSEILGIYTDDEGYVPPEIDKLISEQKAKYKDEKSVVDETYFEYCFVDENGYFC